MAATGGPEAGMGPRVRGRGGGAVPPLLAVLFSQFDDELGPSLVHQAPEGLISKEIHSSLGKYTIPKPELSGRLISFVAHGFQFLGHPVDIPGQLYRRNHLLFNVTFVFDEDVETAAFEPVVKKVASYLKSLELEMHFLHNPETKQQVAGILQRILDGLNTTGECTIPINEANTIRLRVMDVCQPCPALQELPTAEQVPVLWHDLTQSLGELDLATQQLLPHINGVDCLYKVAMRSNVELQLAQLCLHTLAQTGILTFVEAFQFSNVYLVTRAVRRLLEDTALRDRCLAFVAVKEKPPPTLTRVFRLYCQLAPRDPVVTMGAFCDSNNLRVSSIDPVRLVQFGLQTGILRQQKRYPIRNARIECGPNVDTRLTQLSGVLDGKATTDQICCDFGLSSKELDDILDSDPYTLVIRK